MKTRKTILIVLSLLISHSLKAQLKVLGGGRVGIGTNDVSLYKLHVNAPNDVMALKLRNTIYIWGIYQRLK